ncbi:ATP synthase subunit I [Cellvibrio sp. pealriver]|uniref:ATP synthase subunit I n=1 Tax=Cellvibrio sp. pealriver TaxID=1622269 RepID=UPI00066FBC83|nr:ATP synthase subunit I [Cellvibrio sp. pealriver]
MSRYLKGRDIALQTVAAQLVLTLVAAATALAINDSVAISILIGGIIGVTANLWLALIAFRPALGAPTQRMLAAFYMGEFGKFIITAVLFLLAFKQIGFLKEAAYAATMIMAYVIVQVIAWTYPLMRRKV